MLSPDHFRNRPACAADTAATLKLLGTKTRDGYGPSSLEDLAPLLSRLLEERTVRGQVLQQGSTTSDRSGGGMRAVAMTGFIELAHARAWLERPPPHLVDHVLELERAGKPSLLRTDRVAMENACAGVALVFLGFAIGSDPDDPAMSTYIAQMHDGFRLFHAGYFCPLALHPAAPSASGRESLLTAGFQPAGDGKSIWVLDTTKFDQAPHHPLIFLRRSTPPRLGLSPAEKDTLFYAVLGHTDLEIADELHISFETVRKRWRAIFERVSDRAALQIFPVAAGRENPNEAKRGPEKRHILLQYLSAHLEELRPYLDAP